MASKYKYSQVIYNDYLNVSKEIKGNSKREIDIKIQDQFTKWNEQVAAKQERERIQNEKKYERDRIQDLKVRAELMNQDAINKIDRYNSILSKALKSYFYMDWDNKKKYDRYPEFQYNKMPPTIDEIYARLRVPRKSMKELLSSKTTEKRIALEKKAQEVFEKESLRYEEVRTSTFVNWQRDKENLKGKKNYIIMKLISGKQTLKMERLMP